jgi:hypothetical protein
MDRIDSTEHHLKAPRAAAIAGILFSALLITAFLLFRHSVPADPLEVGAWLRARSSTVGDEQLVGSVTFSVARAVAYEAMNVYAIKMAAVFTIVTCTLALRTRFVPHWIAFLGYAAALVLLFANRYVEWALLVFPLWVLLISLYILVDSLRASRDTAAHPSGE